MKSQLAVLVVALAFIVVVLTFGEIAALYFTWSLFAAIILVGMHDAIREARAAFRSKD